LNERLRILLVDDHATVRHGLKLLLEREPDLEVIAEASDGAEAVERAATVAADVIVMDLSMPGTSGLVATRRLKALRPGLAIVTLTRHADKTYLEELLRAGTSATSRDPRGGQRSAVCRSGAHTSSRRPFRPAATRAVVARLPGHGP
jgi:DNA-binding NarL/FixJ family response regulator